MAAPENVIPMLYYPNFQTQITIKPRMVLLGDNPGEMSVV